MGSPARRSTAHWVACRLWKDARAIAHEARESPGSSPYWRWFGRQPPGPNQPCVYTAVGDRMRIEEADIYVCPATSGALRLEADRVENRSVLSGKLVGPDEASYPITDGIPNFVFQQELPASDVESLAYYEREADNYDSWLPMITDTFGVDEVEIRT